MTNTKLAKRSFFVSLMALILCFSMLMGTTFAWFTDSVTSESNIIKSGSLDVEMFYSDTLLAADSADWKDASAGAIFNYQYWEPGYSEVKYIKISNVGDLAFKFKLDIIPAVAAVAGKANLADVIDVYYGVTTDSTFVAPSASDKNGSLVKVGTLTQMMADASGAAHGAILPASGKSSASLDLTALEAKYGKLPEGDIIVALKLTMQETAGNEYQNLKVGDGFSVRLLATQVAAEEDSFDNSYDQDAVYSITSTEAPITSTTTENIVLKTNGAVPMTMTIPGALAASLAGEGITSLSLAHGEANVDKDAQAITYPAVDLLDQNGSVIDLSNNQTPVSISFPSNGVFAEGNVVTVFHDGEEMATPTVTADGEIAYETTHLCEVKAVIRPNVVVTFTDGHTMSFDKLSDAMRVSYSGGAQEKITVYNDITEEMSYLEGNIVCGKKGGVKITNTIFDAWIYCGENFTIGEGVTYDASGNKSGLFVYGKDCVINGTVIMDCYYQRYADTKLTINAPGSMKVNTEMFYLRYTDGDPNAGVYINGDNDDSTVEFQLAVAYFYQGMINAKDATLKVGTYWQTNTTDNAGSANLVLDNSKLTVTVNEHNFKALGNANVTLKNGSVLDVAGGIQTDKAIVVDETSTVKSAR